MLWFRKAQLNGYLLNGKIGKLKIAAGPDKQLLTDNIFGRNSHYLFHNIIEIFGRKMHQLCII